MGEHKSIEDYGAGFRFCPPEDDGSEDDGVDVTLLYPRVDGKPRYVYVDQESVRASDGVRLSYDYDRDGWVVEQRRWPDGTEQYSEPSGWEEVAFVQSWALDGRAEDD